jgi:hypothetical protein
MRLFLRSILFILATWAWDSLAQAAPVSYLQSPLAGGDGFQSSPSGNQRADNFSFGQETQVRTVRWWGTYLNNPPTGSDSFTVRFFEPDPLAGGVPEASPIHQFTGLSIARTNSGLLDAFNDPIYRYEAQLSTPVVFNGGETRFFSVLNGSSNQWFWQKSSNAGTNWFRISEDVGNVWFPAEDNQIGNLAFELIGVTRPPGDYNLDFTVNQTDYSIWKQNFGSTTQLAADGSANGRVDAADYVVWRKHLGAGAGGGSLAAVPEPSSCVLLMTAAIAGGFIIRFSHRPNR